MDVIEALTRLCAPLYPCVIRIECDALDWADDHADDRGPCFAVDGEHSLPAVANAVQASWRSAGDPPLVAFDDRCNGRIGLLLRPLPPVRMVVEASDACARTVSVSLDGSSGDQGILWELGKAYRPTSHSPADALAPDNDTWTKVQWGVDDAERVLRRAELAAWMAHMHSVARDGKGCFEVAIGLRFQGTGLQSQGTAMRAVPDTTVGTPEFSDQSDVDEIIVMDVRMAQQLQLPADGGAP